MLEHPFDGENLKHIKPQSTGELKKIIRRFRLPDNRADFKLIGMDSFIDSEMADAASD